MHMRPQPISRVVPQGDRLVGRPDHCGPVPRPWNWDSACRVGGLDAVRAQPTVPDVVTNIECQCASTESTFGLVRRWNRDMRRSTAMQDLERQVAAIVAAGIEPKHSYPDKKSGSTLDRPGLAGCCGIPALATRSFFTRWFDSAVCSRHPEHHPRRSRRREGLFSTHGHVFTSSPVRHRAGQGSVTGTRYDGHVRASLRYRG